MRAPTLPPPPQVRLRKRRRRSWVVNFLGFLFASGVVVFVAGSAVAGFFLWKASKDLPSSDSLAKYEPPVMTRVHAHDGSLMAEYARERRIFVPINTVPKRLIQAFLSAEDKRFYEHGGLDFHGIARAGVKFIESKIKGGGGRPQGASTITQQVAKNLFLTNARTFRRKVQEVLLTLWLEQHFSKQEILEIWLNRVYLGSGAWGVDAAARLYFGVSARQVNLWQAAVIAGLPRAPSRFSPRVDPGAAAARGREVLAAMVDTGVVTAVLAGVAAGQIAFPARPAAAGWFADWAADRVEAILPPGADAEVRTTLDARMQAAVEARVAALVDGPGVAAGVGQAAVIVMDAGTGAVRAMAGGRDYRASPFNRAVVARRQPGSAFKPFVWLAAVEKGARPDDLVLDAPIRVGGWSPGNYDGKFRGNISLEEALAHSVNTASVRLLIQAGEIGRASCRERV